VATNAQLELATVAYVGWFNNRPLHSSIENRPPVEHEREYWVASRSGWNRFRLRPPQQWLIYKASGQRPLRWADLAMTLTDIGRSKYSTTNDDSPSNPGTDIHTAITRVYAPRHTERKETCLPDTTKEVKAILARALHELDQVIDNPGVKSLGRGYFESSDKLLEMDTFWDRFGVTKVRETGGYRDVPRSWGRLAG